MLAGSPWTASGLAGSGWGDQSGGTGSREAKYPLRFSTVDRPSSLWLQALPTPLVQRLPAGLWVTTLLTLTGTVSYSSLYP